MFSWFKSDRRRQSIREDRKYIVGRSRRFLLSYLTSDDSHKQRCYEVVAGATAACQPQTIDPQLPNTELSRIIADTALRVVKVRERQTNDADGQLASLITDAYATVAMAYRRAAAIYVLDEEMQQIGTAAVHMVTIANSYMAAHSPDTAIAAR